MPTGSTDDRPLLRHLPRLADALPLARLGEFPTRAEVLSVATERGPVTLYVKRDDLSSPVYGGNKVRTLETLFGAALAEGSTRIHSTGAYGTNHGLAAALHARRVGLEPGVILFPQPYSACAEENLIAILGTRPVIEDLPHWSALPFGMYRVARREASEGIRSTVMVPGGATPVGGLGYVNGALELAEQVERGELPAPERIVLGVGSNCTSAGLLVGVRVAAALGIGWEKPPTIRSIRVTPWPVTSATRIAWLATAIAAELAGRAGRPEFAFGFGDLIRGLEVDGSHIGWGYGIPTREGRALIDRFAHDHGVRLDTTYSAKAIAGALAAARTASGPTLFWSTKSTAPLPARLAADELGRVAPIRMRRFLERSSRVLEARRKKGLNPP